jgi:hypothetical protein
VGSTRIIYWIAIFVLFEKYSFASKRPKTLPSGDSNVNHSTIKKPQKSLLGNVETKKFIYKSVSALWFRLPMQRLFHQNIRKDGKGKQSVS